MKRQFQCGTDPRMIRAGSDHKTVSPQPASQPRLLFTPTTSILYWKIQHFAIRLSFQIWPNTAPATKSDTSTSPNTAPATKSDTSTSPNTAPAQKSNTHHWSSSHMLNVIYNARSNKCHCPNSPNIAPATKNESHDWFLVTHETLFTMRGVTSVIVQTHQILRLPRKMNLMIDPCHTWNAIYNARSNKCHCPNSPNTAPATQNDSPKFPSNLSKTDETSVPCVTDPRMIRAGSDHKTVSPQPASQPRLLFALATSNFYRKIQHFALRLSFQISRNAAPATKSDAWTSPNTCACHGKWLSWLILVTYETSFTMRGATEVFLQRHRILRLPHKVTLMIDPHDTWNVIYNARSNRGVSPTSPNTAPATQNDSHDWSAWDMKRHLQCAE